LRPPREIAMCPSGVAHGPLFFGKPELCFLVVFFFVAGAHAQAAPPAGDVAVRLTDEPLVVSVKGCAHVDLSGLPGILAIELGALSAETAEWLAANRIEVQLRCDEAKMVVQAIEPLSGRFTGQHLESLEDMKNEMARFVALTIVELIASRATNPEKAEPPKVHPMKAVSPGHAERPASPPESYPHLAAEVHFVLYGGMKPFSLSVGAGITAGLVALKFLVLAIDFQFFTGATDASIGDIRSDAFSGAFFVLGRAAHAVGVIEPGVGIRAGALLFNGLPDDSALADGAKTTLPYGGPCVALLSRFDVWKRVHIAVNAEAGYTIFRADARVDNEVALSQRGAWFLAGIGIGMVFR
jgi:hypothetical protein